MEGNKGEKSQSTASSYDENSNVVFFAELQKDGVGCWNTKKELKPENVALVAQDHEKLLFPNDIKVNIHSCFHHTKIHPEIFDCIER